MANEKQLLNDLRHIIFQSYKTGLLEKIDKHKLTFLQRNILLTLKNHGELRMTDLCRLLVLQKPAMTRLVDNLEERGFIKRTKIADDRRGYCISLTDKVENIINGLEDIPLGVLKEVLSRSSQEEQKLFSRSFSIFLDKLNKIDTDYFKI